MKLLKGLHQQVRDLDGHTNPEADEKTKYCKLCALSVATMNAAPADKIRAWELAQKLHKADDELVLEDDQVRLLRQALEGTQNLSALACGQLLEWLNTAENYEINVDKK
jgi:hypothetical protein